MIMVLQIAGIVAVLVGLVTVGLGIPVKEFSFGNTLILSGTVGLCTGLILLGLSVVALELKQLTRRLMAGSRQAAESRGRPALPPFPGAAAEPQAPGMVQVEPVAPPAPAAWQDDPRARQEPSPMAPEPVPPAAAPPPAKPKRNLLFQSNVRKERERAAAGMIDPSALEPRAPAGPPTPDAGGPPPAATFEDAWPRTDRGRPGEAAPQRRSGRLSAQPGEPNAGAVTERSVPPPPPKGEDQQPGVTVLKSGVVDGMAYSLYSDGSIEAQMPEGMMRFASIDELRAHLDQRPS